METALSNGALDVSAWRRFRTGMQLLVQARHYAHQIGRDVWDFAVEINALRSTGLTNSDLRWLVCMGYAGHAQEICQVGGGTRSFRDIGMSLSRRSCFVLTEDGLRHLEEHRLLDSEFTSGARPVAVQLPADDEDSDQRAPSRAAPVEAAAASVPTWDRHRQELRVGSMVVKEFKLPSPNQETILAAFEEEGWPPRIDDPLPPNGRSGSSRRRLHDTIKSLNRHQKQRLIQFAGDGTGEGVRWRLIRTTKAGISAGDASPELPRAGDAGE